MSTETSDDLAALWVRETREGWLLNATTAMRNWFIEVGMPLPERIYVSPGFGHGAQRESAIIQGQAWASWKSADGVSQIFISPVLVKGADVLDTLLHLLIHVADDLQSGHRGRFAEAATRLGLIGKPTEMLASPQLRDKLELLAFELGPYPHSELRVDAKAPSLISPDGDRPGATLVLEHGTSGKRPDHNRQRKAVCDAGCGYTIRASRKWFDVGLPTCPCGGTITPVE